VSLPLRAAQQLLTPGEQVCTPWKRTSQHWAAVTSSGPGGGTLSKSRHAFKILTNLKLSCLFEKGHYVQH